MWRSRIIRTSMTGQRWFWWRYRTADRIAFKKEMEELASADKSERGDRSPE